MANLYATGSNGQYQLGFGDNAAKTSYAQVPGNWIAYSHSSSGWSMGIKSDGTLWAVGLNTVYQLGLSGGNRTVLEQVGTDTDWVDVRCGSQHAMALKANGKIYISGRNSEGQGGRGNYTTPITTFTVVPGTDVWVKISAGFRASFAVRNDGLLFGWGDNTYGVLGQGAITSSYPSPVQIVLPAAVAQLSTPHDYFTLAILTDGRLYAWGDNTYYQLGLNDDTLPHLSPVQVGVATDWQVVACGTSTSYAIKTNGTAWTTGDGASYQTAQGTPTSFNQFTQIGAASNWVGVVAGSGSVQLLDANNDVHVVGANTDGQLGTGGVVNVTTLSNLRTVYGRTLPAGSYAMRMANFSSLILATENPPTAPMRLTVSRPTSSPSAPMRLTVLGKSSPAAPLSLAVLEPGALPRWTARCIIGGVDISSTLTGLINVTASEGAARVASISILPPVGTVSPLDYVGKTISIDFVSISSEVSVPRRLFTGRVDTPVYDLNTNILRLECVDDLQNRVAALSRDVIDTLIGGRYTTAVQGEILDNWDYAEARLTTVEGSLDAGPSGELRVTPWQLTATYATLTAPNLLWNRSVLTLPQRSTLVNSVEIALDYQYARLRQRDASVAWSGTNIEMLPNGYQYPTQSEIIGAASGTGWTPTAAIYYPAPATIPHSSGGYIVPREGSISLAIVSLSQRHSQTVRETYTMLVTAPESITANGELPAALRGALASDFDGRAWESALDVAPLMPGGGDMDYAPDVTRSDADYAIQTLLDQAAVKIRGSHRSARVTNAVLCNPELDLNKKLAISTPEQTVSGKVGEVVHTLDIDSGSAVTQFSLACFGVGGAGIITPTTLAPPSPPAEATETQTWGYDLPRLAVSTFGSTVYQDGLMGLLVNPPENITVYDVPTVDGPRTQSLPNPSYVAGAYPVTGFRVQMPGVDDADRNPLTKPVTASYQIIIPTDPLTFTRL